jgi:N-acetyltransferase 10
VACFAGEMPLKKIDNRLRTLIENGVALRYRSLFVVVGDHGRDQVSDNPTLPNRCM